MDKNLYKFGMDWLNGVLPVTDVWEVFQTLEKFSSKLKFDRWEFVNSGKYNYSRRYCLDGKASIQLMYNPVSDEEWLTARQPMPDNYAELSEYEKMNYHNNSGVFFSISGDGIRYLHSLGGKDITALHNFLFYLYNNGFKCSRFDTYCDVLDSGNEIVPLLQKAFDNFYQPKRGKPTIKTNVQRNRNNVSFYSNYDDNGKKFTNVTLGHHGTRFGMFRCYNKLVEVSDGRLSEFAPDILKDYGVTDYWYRLELEIHKENAVQCFNAVMEFALQNDNVLCFEGVFYACLFRIFNVVSYTTVTVGNCPLAPAWASFGSELQASSEYLVQFRGVPYIECSLPRLSKNTFRIKGYFYAMLQYILALPPNERFEFLLQASDTFEANKKYNSLRDELDIMPLKEIEARLKKFDLIA